MILKGWCQNCGGYGCHFCNNPPPFAPPFQPTPPGLPDISGFFKDMKKITEFTDAEIEAEYNRRKISKVEKQIEELQKELAKLKGETNG